MTTQGESGPAGKLTKEDPPEKIMEYMSKGHFENMMHELESKNLFIINMINDDLDAQKMQTF